MNCHLTFAARFLNYPGYIALYGNTSPDFCLMSLAMSPISTRILSRKAQYC